MNSTPCDRQSVALLTCESLPTEAAAELRQHLQQCAACREYFRELSAVCGAHASAARSLPAAETSARLHRRVAAGIRARPRSAWREFFAANRPLGLNLAGAAVALGLLLLLGLIWSRHSTPPVRVTVSSAPTPQAEPESFPTGSSLMAYRLALNRSSEDLDRLLTREAARPANNSAASFRSDLARLDAGL